MSRNRILPTDIDAELRACGEKPPWSRNAVGRRLCCRTKGHAGKHQNAAGHRWDPMKVRQTKKVA